MTPHSPAEPRTPMPAGGKPSKPSSAVTGQLSGCRPDCPICTGTTAPQDWDVPWPAYRWSPELEDQ